MDTDELHHAAEPPVQQPSSRICVKNIPKHVDEDRLKEHFAQKGEVTDAKVMRTRDGKSRCFAFVGYASVEDAKAAVHYFNKTFMDALRLEVEFAYKYGSDERPRAWSKYTEGTSAHHRMQKAASGANTEAVGKERKKSKKKKEDDAPLDPKLNEFLSLMQPRSKQAIWANDDAFNARTVATTATAIDKKKDSAIVLDEGDDGNDSDDDLYVDLPVRSQDGNDRSNGDDNDNDDETMTTRAFDPVVTNTAISDLEYLNSRVRKNFDDDSDNPEEEEEDLEEEEEEEEEEEDQEEEDIKSRKPSLKREEKDTSHKNDIDRIFHPSNDHQDQENSDTDIHIERRGHATSTMSIDKENQRQPQEEEDAVSIIGSTARLFIRNLPYTATEGDLRDAFQRHGEIKEVHIVLDKTTRKSKGYALLLFESPSDAIEAYRAMDGSIFMGRLLHVLPGKHAPVADVPTTTLLNTFGNDGDNGGGGGANVNDGAGNKSNAGTSYKKQREANLKASAQSNTAAWNTLFMRADTVAEAVAAHYGVKKSDLLDAHAQDMAVRLALGETHVIAETKAALASAGVDVALLEKAAAAGGHAKKNSAMTGDRSSLQNTDTTSNGNTQIKRSECVLIVKNLPYTSSEGELEELFGSVGSVSRIVLPSTRTVALVEYSEAQDARRAFKTLAYKRYHSVPIYLEWAPLGIFNSHSGNASKIAVSENIEKNGKADPLRSSKNDAIAAAAKEKKTKKEKRDQEKNENTPASAHDVAASLAATVSTHHEDAVESSTIYVKNLAFSTDDASLQNHFAASAALSAGGGEEALRSVKVARRKMKDGKLLSAGFGFVECSDEVVARAVIKELQGSLLDGHRLTLQLSDHSTSTAAPKSAKKSSEKTTKKGDILGSVKGAAQPTKVVVRNVAFEATRKDILGLFTPFGHVKSCRLPRKFDGTHRGFAFVEFATRQEALTTVEAVAGTHLYGRRLVIEWAAEDGGLDELRAKTASKYRGDEDALQNMNGEDDGEEEHGKKRKR